MIKTYNVKKLSNNEKCEFCSCNATQYTKYIGKKFRSVWHCGKHKIKAINMLTDIFSSK